MPAMKARRPPKERLCLVVIIPDKHTHANKGEKEFDCDYKYVLHNKISLCFMPLHREHSAGLPIEGWSSDFPPLPDAFSSNWTMALLSGSHNGVHCCGTVGDSHSHSQLIAAKRTFLGEGRGEASIFTWILQNHGAKIQLFFKTNRILAFFFIFSTKKT